MSQVRPPWNYKPCPFKSACNLKNQPDTQSDSESPTFLDQIPKLSQLLSIQQFKTQDLLKLFRSNAAMSMPPRRFSHGDTGTWAFGGCHGAQGFKILKTRQSPHVKCFLCFLKCWYIVRASALNCWKKSAENVAQICAKEALFSDLWTRMLQNVKHAKCLCKW
jgi:hypothetical protein